jgi:Ca2+-binding RTX toxin-like protein
MRRVVLLLAAMAVALLVSSGVALAVIKTCPTNCFGTQGPDTLDGSTNANVIKALGGGDRVHGWRGNDAIYGNPDDDALYGDYGDDSVYGGDGNDYVEGGYGQDYIDTGDGSDKVGAKDGYKDHIVCGQGGSDLVYKDSFDTTRGC